MYLYNVYFENQHSAILVKEVIAETIRDAIITAYSNIRPKKDDRYIPIKCEMQEEPDIIKYEDIRSDNEFQSAC